MEHQTTDPNINDSLTKTLAASDLSSIANELTELSVDALLGEGVLRDLPIVGSLVAIWKTGATVRDALFVRKLTAFLAQMNEIPSEQRSRMLEVLQNESKSENVGEKLLGLLDRIETSANSKFAGRAFRLFVDETITPEEFWRVAYIIERLPLHDFVAVKNWAGNTLGAVEHVRKHLYLSVGLGWFVMSASNTGFQWQERLCTIIADHLLHDEE